MSHREDGLNIPESYREIAIHLRAIRTEVAEVTERLDNLESTMNARRFRFQDLMLSSLLLPLVGGMLLFLLTKTLG